MTDDALRRHKSPSSQSAEESQDEETDISAS